MKRLESIRKSDNSMPGLFVRSVDLPPSTNLSEVISTSTFKDALKTAGQLLGSGFPEDCIRFLKQHALMKRAIAAPEFIVIVERAVATSLRKGLHKKAEHIIAAFQLDSETLSSKDLQRSAWAGALLKTREGRFDYANKCLKITDQDPDTFFASPKASSAIINGLLAIGLHEREGLRKVVGVILENNIPVDLLRSSNFQKHATGMIETGVKNIRSDYRFATKRMKDITDFIDQVDLREQLCKDTDSAMMQNVQWIVGRLEHDGLAHLSKPIRKYFGI